MVRRKVLVVDDDKINSKFLTKMLEKRNFEAFVMHSGQECLDFIRKKRIEIVLLDIMMPDYSGLEVLQEIRTHFKQVELPIIMVTAKSDVSDIVEALNLGANDYLTKPVSIDIAVARINTQLNLVDLNRDSLRKKELETLKMMITTYNHEINNPLTIALVSLKSKITKMDQKSLDRSIKAVRRIANIVKKIEKLTTEMVETTEYIDDSKMIDLK
jgi:DNA-binding response OmpR family regulator